MRAEETAQDYSGPARRASARRLESASAQSPPAALAVAEGNEVRM